MMVVCVGERGKREINSISISDSIGVFWWVRFMRFMWWRTALQQTHSASLL